MDSIATTVEHPANCFIDIFDDIYLVISQIVYLCLKEIEMFACFLIYKRNLKQIELNFVCLKYW